MSKAKAIWIEGDRTAKSVRAWKAWMDSAAELVDRFDQEQNDDPFAYNETASASLLASAAARCGFLGLAEYAVSKKGKEKYRTRRRGRCDLWLADAQTSWAFEIKQLRPDYRLSEAHISRAVSRAAGDAWALTKGEATHRVGLVIVSTYWMHEALTDKEFEASQEALHDFASKSGLITVVIRPRNYENAADTWAYFNLHPKDWL